MNVDIEELGPVVMNGVICHVYNTDVAIENRGGG